MPYFSAIGMHLALLEIMARNPLVRTSEFPYHVRARTNNQSWFPLHMDEVWRIFEYYITEICIRYGAKIGSFVLMSNHFHMIIWTPNENLDEIMHYLLREVSKKINEKAGRINHLFGGPYKWTIVDNERYLGHVYRYNYQNPVRVRLSDRVETYRYSTAYFLFNKIKLKFDIHHELLCDLAKINPDIRKQIHWLNESLSKKQIEATRLALKKKFFQFPKHSSFNFALKTLI